MPEDLDLIQRENRGQNAPDSNVEEGALQYLEAAANLNLVRGSNKAIWIIQRNVADTGNSCFGNTALVKGHYKGVLEHAMAIFQTVNHFRFSFPKSGNGSLIGQQVLCLRVALPY